MPRGTGSRERRSASRASGVNKAHTAAASGATDLPLSDRDAAWDASKASQSLSEDQLADAHFWRDPDGDPATKAAYKLGFASDESGTLTAIWRGVTAAAGAVQGARGGVDIPAADVPGVKSRIEKYYAKAATEYDDPNIKPPWAASAEDTAAMHEALGFTLKVSRDEYLEAIDDDDVAVFALAYAEAVGEGFGDESDPVVVFTDRCDYWMPLLSERYQHRVKCECRHSLYEHAGADGPCSHEDGRGKCRCAGFSELAVDPESTELTAVELDTEIVEVVAAGELLMAPEDSVKDLMRDIDSIVAVYDGDYCCVDVNLGFTKALIKCEDDGEHYVAGLTVDPATGEPTLAGLTEWVCVGKGWIAEDEPAGYTAAGEELLPDEHQPGSTVPARQPGPVVPVVEQPVNASLKKWEATIAPEGVLTDDGRAFAPGSITWRELPLTLMAMTETSEGGHIGAEVAGRIDNIWREGNVLRATGVFDEGEYGQEIARLVGEGTLRGVSVDLGVREFEVGSKADYFDEDGNWAPKAAAAEDDEEGPSLLDLLFGGDEDSIFVVTDAVIGMVTVCPFPAFADATIALTAAAKWTVTLQSGITVVEQPVEAGPELVVVEQLTAAGEPLEGLTASAAGMVPVEPPAAWFDNPELTELTPLVVTADGRVYGHAAAWDTCHIGIPDVCTTAPHSNTEYAYFHLGEVVCDDGELISCGHITLGTGHADKNASRAEASHHYDNTGFVAADVRVGDDEHGIWIAGALRPDADALKVRELRAAVLSGDWRNVNGNLELVALLAVNVPGFPVPRQRALVAAIGEGENEHVEVLALVAAGHVFATPIDDAFAELATRAATIGKPPDEFALLAERAALTAADFRSPDVEFAELAERALR